MAKIPVDRVVPGMKLAKPVLNEQGMVLLNEGLELTEELIERLKAMGLEGVHIKGMSRPAQPKEELLSALDERFGKVESEPHMAMIKEIIRKHIEGLYEKD